MKQLLLNVLKEHLENCGDIRGCNGEYLSAEVNNAIDLVQRLPSDDEIIRLRAESVELSWTKNPDRMGQ